MTAWLVAAGLCAACPGQLDDPSRFLGDGAIAFSGPSDVFRDRCGTAGCHNAEDLAGELDLVSPGVAARLIAAPAKGCNGPLVAPGEPDDSVLYQKLTEQPPCGERMPYGEEPLDQEARMRIREWIAGL